MAGRFFSQRTRAGSRVATQVLCFLSESFPHLPCLPSPLLQLSFSQPITPVSAMEGVTLSHALAKDVPGLAASGGGDILPEVCHRMSLAAP